MVKEGISAIFSTKSEAVNLNRGVEEPRRV